MGAWSTGALLYPASPEPLSTRGLADSPIYTSAGGCRFAGLYSITLQFTATTTDTSTIALVAGFGSTNSFAAELPMNWGGTAMTQQCPCNVGTVIYWQMLKRASPLAWPASTLRIVLTYLGTAN